MPDVSSHCHQSAPCWQQPLTHLNSAACADVLFLSDGTATASRKMHDATLLNLRYGFARVLSCADAAQALRRAAGGGG